MRLGVFLLLAALLPLGLAAPARAADIAHFTAATPSEPDSFDITSSREPGGSYVTALNLYEQLWGIDHANRPVKTVADWEIAPDHRSITFRIRPGVKFQSGDELTADDAVFSFNRIAARSPMYQRHAKLVDRVTALDRYTARFDFNTPDFGFFNSGLVYLVSKAYFDRVGEAEAVAHPKGIGPYELVDYQPGQYADFRAFADYWGPQPPVRAARVFFVKDEQTRLAKLRAGEVDLIMDAPYPAVDGLKQDNFRTVGAESWPTVAIQFQLNNPASPWHEAKVRLAIAHAVDADAIVAGLLHGIPKRYPGLAAGEFGYDPDLKNYSYDPALAKKLLAEAGYPNGFTMPLFYWAGTFYGIRETTEAVTLYLRNVGITADVQGLDPSKIMAMLRRGRGDPAQNYAGVVAMPITNTGMNPVESVGLMYLSNGTVNTYANPALDEVIQHMLVELDDAKRADLVRQAMRIVHDEAVDIPLWNSVSIYAMKAKFDYAPVQHRNALLRLADVSAAPVEK